MFIKFYRKNDLYSGHAINVVNEFPEKLGQKVAVDSTSGSPLERDFLKLLFDFRQDFSMYESPIAATFDFNSAMGNVIVEKDLVDFIQNNAVKIGADEVYEFPDHLVGEVFSKSDVVRSWNKARIELPKVAIIGLIATLDNYIAKVARIICKQRPNAVFGKEKSVPYTDFMSLANLDDLKNFLV